MTEFQTVIMPDGQKSRRLLVGRRRFDLMATTNNIFSEAMCHSTFEVGFESQTRWEAIPKMVEAMFFGSSFTYDELRQITAVLLKRESSMSTGIGFGISFPHASSDLIKCLALGFFRFASPINWDAIDRQPVDYACCLVVPHGQYPKSLTTLAKVVKEFNKKQYRETASKCELEEWCALTCQVMEA